VLPPFAETRVRARCHDSISSSCVPIAGYGRDEALYFPSPLRWENISFNRICVSFPQGAEFLLGNLTRGPIRTFCWGPGRFKYIFWGSGILRDEEGRIWVFGMEGLEINRLGTFPTENVGEGFAQGIRLMPHPPHWSLVHPRQENMP
jgi:hypothetical protein